MTIIVHDHGAPDPVVIVVEDPVHLVVAVESAPPAPPTVKEVAAVVEFADVVDKKKSP